jgi:hypothetical protein
MPGGKLQERAVAAAHFHGLYGDGLATAYWEQLDLDPRLLSAIVPPGAAETPEKRQTEEGTKPA